MTSEIRSEPVPHANEENTSTRNRKPPSQQPLSSPPTPSIKIRESSPHGTHRQTYIISPSSSSITTLPPPPTPPSSSPSTSHLLRLLTPFLPTNYPHSVTPDYTSYQLYDSLQAFASSIAALLASRAVLTSLGVDSDSTSTSIATYATLLSIVQNSISHFATIFFAHYFAVRIEAEVKFYRFLADIVNDAAFMLDVLSPSLAAYARIAALCTASACRAVCGVCGGSSKAILSAHFARAGNIGELNAKDSSQEVLVSLVGMWVGGLVVGGVEGGMETWVWMLGLLAAHLWANWMAVRSVRLKTLNRGRAGMVFGRLLEGRSDFGVEDVGKDERLFERGDAIRMQGEVEGYCKFVDFRSLSAALERSTKSQMKSEEGVGTLFTRLVKIFEAEEYLLWLDHPSRQCLIILKDGATTDTQLKAWCHAFILTMKVKRFGHLKNWMLDALDDTLLDNAVQWDEWKTQLGDCGWDLSASDLAVAEGSRVHLEAE